ncbi:hypothetical protein C9I43_11620 [Shewanella morhuae]|uniref:Uncharacterized protein n=1 Tax=Shewanella morhuae TaxID=365591 RepID=A0A1N6SLV6_9GAMM|nr:hypothetical protein [Shewanella morhuae]PTA51099.1 hypothetical protein C9I43_11620 [Shewanella morhuae]GIU04748.1 hypothetical protein TUM4641_13470 [Shewanella morhuae]SIQ42088.1 hypothetical protein SAMN05421840_10175 [Shewanella morhuae]SUI77692.1 Uncharacterised protein [Shewanella morhuae]
MEKSTQWMPENGLSRLSWVAMLLCIGLFVFEYFWGNDFTTMVVMLYCSFMLPAVLLTRSVQEKYFIYTLEYIVPFRKFTALMSLIFLCIWIIATSLQLFH